MVRLAVFASGSGSNFENLFHASQGGALGCKPALLIADQPQAYALTRAEKLGVPAAVADYSLSKKHAEEKILHVLREHRIEFIALAGWMRILSPQFLKAYPNKIVNIHPAYLPEFPGRDGIGDAFRAKASQTGVTVHYVDEGIDTGAVILQQRIIIQPEWSLEELIGAVHALEYRLYPQALKQIFRGE